MERKIESRTDEGGGGQVKISEEMFGLIQALLTVLPLTMESGMILYCICVLYYAVCSVCCFVCLKHTELCRCLRWLYVCKKSRGACHRKDCELNK